MKYRILSVLLSLNFFIITGVFGGPADVQSRDVKVALCKNLVSEQFLYNLRHSLQIIPETWLTLSHLISK